MIKNCVNCGAPIHGSVCEYCGTRYDGSGISANFDRGDCTGVLNIGGNEYRVYLGSMEAHSVYSENSGRDMSGRLIRDTVRMIHKFELVEV